MKTIITVGQSVQVIQVGQPEKWNKVTIQKEFDGDVPEQSEIDILFEKVEMAHEKHSKSFVEEQKPFVGAVKKESIEDLKKEFNAGHK